MKILRVILFTLLLITLGTASLLSFNARYTRTGTIVEIWQDAILIHGSNPHDPVSVLPLERESKFYDADGNEISLLDLKPGTKVEVRLFPRSYGPFLVRPQKTVRWVKVLRKEM